MIPSCRNCLYCEIKKGKYVDPEGGTWYGDTLKSYLCNKDMLYKNSDNLCSNWAHKNYIIRKTWNFFNS